MKRGMSFFIIFCLLLITRCSNALFDALGDFAEYSVTYKENGSETGTVPDSAIYERGMIVAVPGNTGNLVKSNFVFTGWNTQENGKGRNYEQETFIMQPADMALYARWSAEIAIVSMNASGTLGNNNSAKPSLNSDGRYIAFESGATNLVAGDTNGSTDIFVNDRDADGNDIFETGAGKTAITLVSINSDGEIAAGGQSSSPSISRDGRYIAFESGATNLVSGDTNSYTDIFLHDRDADGNNIFDETGAGKTATTRINLAPDGITEADDHSNNPSLSGDGRYVAFLSNATNLVTGDTNGLSDIFVHDCVTGTTTRISVASDGTQGTGNSSSPSISDDGTYIAFSSEAANLVADDTNSSTDIFLHNRQTGVTIRTSVASDGTQGTGNSFFPYISNDGIYITFSSEATNLVAGDTNISADVFLHNRQTGITTRISIASDGTQGNNHSLDPTLSGDGRFVAFKSIATNLVSGDTNGISDVFVHDRQKADTMRVSVAADGTEADGITNYTPSISSDGRYVAFDSNATNLVAGDSNGQSDIFAAPVR